LSQRVRCVVDPEIQRATNTEEVPSRISLRLTDTRVLVSRIDHPRGSPHRRMEWNELHALFADTVAGILTTQCIDEVVRIVARLDRNSGPRDITGAFRRTV